MNTAQYVCVAVIAFLNSRGAPVRWGKVTEPPPCSEWAKKGAHLSLHCTVVHVFCRGSVPNKAPSTWRATSPEDPFHSYLLSFLSAPQLRSGSIRSAISAQVHIFVGAEDS